MSRFRLFLIILISALVIGGSVALWATVNNGDNDEKVPLSNVPAKVLEAANNAVSGGDIKEVEKEVEDGEVIYEVEKVVDGVEYDIKVTPDGVVKKVEKEDDDEGEDDDEVDDD